MIGPARLTTVQIGLAAAAALAGLVVVALRPSAGLVAYWLVPVLIAAVILTLAGVVARRAPDNWCGPLMAFCGLALVVTNASDVYLSRRREPTARLPLSPYLIAFYQGAWMTYYVPLALLMLFFPTGRLLGPRWRWVAAGLVVVPVLFAIAAGLAPMAYAEPFADRPRAFAGSDGGRRGRVRTPAGLPRSCSSPAPPACSCVTAMPARPSGCSCAGWPWRR